MAFTIPRPVDDRWKELRECLGNVRSALERLDSFHGNYEQPRAMENIFRTIVKEIPNLARIRAELATTPEFRTKVITETMGAVQGTQLNALAVAIIDSLKDVRDAMKAVLESWSVAIDPGTFAISTSFPAPTADLEAAIQVALSAAPKFIE